MLRPKKVRAVGCKPGDRCFKPLYVPREKVRVVDLTLDELEALRLCDLLYLEQNAAARRMQVHRSTVSRILTCAHGKVAKALVHNCGIRIKGGCFKIRKRKLE